MKKILSTLILLIALITSFIFVPTAHSALIFSDPLINNFNTAWYIPDGFSSPTNSSLGISGVNLSNWSALEYSLNQNTTYKVILDVYINRNPSSHVWGMGIEDGLGKWKVLNASQSNLQLREQTESGEHNTTLNWTNTIGEHHFEIEVSSNANTEFKVSQDGQFLGSLVTTSSFNITGFWISILGNSDYYISNFKLCDNEDCTQITPTPTPTLTPTPTPYQPPVKKKVIVIPGYFGSFNAVELIACDLSTHIGKWKNWPAGDLFYQPIIRSLTNANFDVLPFYYDWRKTAPDNADDLLAFIQTNIPNSNEKFDIVAHSFGGLVARAYLENTGVNSRIDRLITAGTPHRGTAVAYPAWTAGDIWIDGPLGTLLQGLVKWCEKANNTNSRETLRTIAPSVENLLPIHNYLINSKTGDPFTNTHEVNNWLLGNSFPNIYDIKLATLNGMGNDTLSTISVTPDKPKNLPLNYWLDGYAKPKDGTKSSAGDGTVLNGSSALAEATENFTIQSEHKDLVSSTEGQRKILDFLGATTAETSAYIPTEYLSALMVFADPGMFWVSHPDGSIHKGNHIYWTENPTNGTYKLLFLPTALSSRILIGKFLPNGKSIWKDYEQKTMLPKFETINFDPEENEVN